MTRRKFGGEFRGEAVKLATERGVTVAQACRDLAESVLRRWMREATVAPATAFPGNGQQRPELAEIAALKKEVAKLEAERDAPQERASHVRHWFKHNGERLLRAGGDITFAFFARHRHIWPVSWMCEVLGVSRSGFHAWHKRPISARASYDAKLILEIDKSFKASDRTYGARRVWRDVLEDGLACGLHRIDRLGRQNAIRARPKRRGKPKDDGERSLIADNILDRDFQADRPNQKWLADVTYIWTAHPKQIVFVIIGKAEPVAEPFRRRAFSRITIFGMPLNRSECCAMHERPVR